MIEAQERHDKSPKKVTSCTARCGSSGGLLIYSLARYLKFVKNIGHLPFKTETVTTLVTKVNFINQSEKQMVKWSTQTSENIFALSSEHFFQ